MCEVIERVMRLSGFFSLCSSTADVRAVNIGLGAFAYQELRQNLGSRHLWRSESQLSSESFVYVCERLC